MNTTLSNMLDITDLNTKLKETRKAATSVHKCVTSTCTCRVIMSTALPLNACSNLDHYAEVCCIDLTCKSSIDTALPHNAP